VVDFTNTIIIATSNLGSDIIQRNLTKRGSSEFDEAKQKTELMEVLRHHFRPEFINRIDEIVVFHGLDAKHIASIAKIQLRNLEKRLAAHDMALTVSDAALEEIAKAGFDPVYGARPLKRAIQQSIENPIARLVLEGKFGPKDVIPVDYRDGRFAFERVVH
jgi:ATP-dependent Clp protease ATP-binding subunit ClpB